MEELSFSMREKSWDVKCFVRISHAARCKNIYLSSAIFPV